mgnify:FL=1
MKRLEHIRTLRNQTARMQAKTPGGAVMVLAQLAQEKHRLQQEKGNWETRVHKIEARLKKIEEMEEQLLSVANLLRTSRAGKPGAGLDRDLPPGFTAAVLRY